MSVVRNCHNHLMVTSVLPVFHSSADGSQVGPQISSRENSLLVPLFLVSLAFHSRSKIILIISVWGKVSSRQSTVTDYLGSLYAIWICFLHFRMGRWWARKEGKHEWGTAAYISPVCLRNGHWLVGKEGYEAVLKRFCRNTKLRPRHYYSGELQEVIETMRGVTISLQIRCLLKIGTETHNEILEQFVSMWNIPGKRPTLRAKL